MDLTIQHHQPDPDTTVIELSGKLLLGPGCNQLEKLVNAELAEGRQRLIFDLAGITHIDSTGIGRFIDAFNRLHASGGQMTMTGAKGPVREMFHITRLDTVLPFADSPSGPGQSPQSPS